MVTAMELIFFVLLYLSSAFHETYADVIGITNNNGTEVFQDLASTFGTSIDNQVTGILVNAEPFDACTKIKMRPYPQYRYSNVTMNAFALIKRGSCDFGTKVFNAQNAKFDGAIVFNDQTDNLIQMSSNSPHVSEIDIPSVFVGLTSGMRLNNSYLYFYKTNPVVDIVGYTPFSLKDYIIPFAAVIGICFLLLIAFGVVKYIRDRRHERRNRLSRARLKQLPVKQFQKGDAYDVCAICLEEYEVAEKLRILPCQHAYHCKCVDPWLTSSKRVCPLCKRRVLSDDETSSNGSDYSDTDEQAPLLSSAATAAASPNSARFATGFLPTNPLSSSSGRSLSASSAGHSRINRSYVDSDHTQRSDQEETPRSSPTDAPSRSHEFHSVDEASSVAIAGTSPVTQELHPVGSHDLYSCESGTEIESAVSSYRDAEEVMVLSGHQTDDERQLTSNDPSVI